MDLNLAEIESKLGLQFKNKNLLLLSFVHRSYWNENQSELREHNERLEFLGDSVLGLILAEYLYTELPAIDEGGLSHLKARLVEASSCVNYVTKLAIGDYVLLGKGERLNKGRGRESILADLFEAIMGAIYLDIGYEGAKNFFFKHFLEEVKQTIAHPHANWKALLQDYAQKKYQFPPLYEVLEESGPSHEKIFKIAVFINQEKVGEGEGSSKKEAQAKAACDACVRLGLHV